MVWAEYDPDVCLICGSQWSSWSTHDLHSIGELQRCITPNRLREVGLESIIDSQPRYYILLCSICYDFVNAAIRETWREEE